MVVFLNPHHYPGLDPGSSVMQTQDLMQSAMQSLARNKSRAILTVLGIVIGIAAVILMLSIGQGAQALILNQVADLGSDQIFVESGAGDTEGGPPSPFIEQTITLKDVEALRRRGPFSFVSAQTITNTTVESSEESFFSNVVGVDQYQLEVFPASIAYGRFIDESDVDSYANVVVLGADAASDLFGDADALGKKVSIKNGSYKVIGVLDEQGSRFFTNLDTQLYIPVTAALRNVVGSDYLSYIAARATVDIATAEDEARWILRDTHNIDNPDGDLVKDDFAVSSQQDAAATIGVVGSTLTLLLASIAAISLVVGGIGIMNIMLVSVTERTKEIGLRKAIGATSKEVLRQFLVEAVFLTFVGGLMGMMIGVGLSFIIATILSRVVDGWTLVIPPEAIVASIVVSTIVGIAFGWYPAKRAAKLDPIEALRYE
jgi:putative ABC transport system permease protein